MRHKRTYDLPRILGISAILTLSACGGGGSQSNSNPGTTSLTGVVAVGKPFANASVSIRDANGKTLSVTSGADGTYLANITGLSAPLLIKVPNPAGTTLPPLYGIATAAGTANVHPFTDMIVRNWYAVQGSNVDSAFNAAGALPTPPTANDIVTMEHVVRQVIGTYMRGANVNPVNFDLMNTPFNTNHTGFDLVLDNLKVTQPATAGGNVTIGLAGGGANSNILSVPGTTAISSLTPPPAPVSDTTAPTTPGAITASRVSGTQVVLSWGASTDNISVAGYKVYQNGVQNGITDQPFYIDGAASGTPCYTVAAFDTAGNSSAQNTQVCASAATIAADTVPPSAPVLTASASLTAASSQIDLSWTASTDNIAVAGYRVLVGGTAIATLPATATTFSHKGLNASTSYSYTVVAIDTSGNATSSAVARANTSAKTDTTAPSVPSGVTATAVSSSQINLTWTASTDNVGVAGYRISGTTLVGTSATNAFSAITLAASTQYCYTVAAYDAAGNVSAASTQACATTQAAGAVGGTPPTAGSTPATGITATMTAFQNLFATALPAATDPKLTALFASTFLNDGENFSQWAAGITTSPSAIGMKLTNLQVISVDATGTVAQIQFTPVSSTGASLAVDQPGGMLHWQMKLNAATGTWQFDGNQHLVRLAIQAFAEHSTCGPTCTPATMPDTYATGLSLVVGQTSAVPIGTIAVTGPGLPLNGLTMTPGVNGWTIKTANVNVCQDAWPSEWCMSDAEILNAPAGSTYTFKLYDTSPTPVLLGTYPVLLPSTPIANTALAAQTYPTLTNLPNISAGIAATTLTPTWTVPANKKGDKLMPYIWQSTTGVAANTTVQFLNMASAGSGIASIVVPAPAVGTWNSAVWNITAFDLNQTTQFRTFYR